MGYSKQITYNTAGSAVTLFCQWLILMIIPKITDFQGAGVFAVAISLCSILTVFSTFSLNQYQISDQYRRYSESDYRATRIVTATLSLAMCSVMLLFFSYSAEQNMVILAYMIYCILLTCSQLYNATLMKQDRLDIIGKCMMLEGAVSLTSFTTVYYTTNDLALAVAVMAVTGGGTMIASVSYGHRKVVGRGILKGDVDRMAVVSLLKLGIPLLISALAPIAITALPKLFLQASDGYEIVGIFSTLSAPTIIIPTLITSVFAPFIIYFSNLSRNGEMSKLRRQYTKAVGLILMLGLFCFIISIFAGGYVFEMLYGESILPYVKYFEILVIGITFYSIGICGTTVLITKEQWRPGMIMAVTSLLASVLILLFMIPRYGIEGATYGLLASYGVFGLLISLCVVMLPLKTGKHSET